MAKLVLIDGHALAYRQFFALPLSSFTTSSGQPTNAVYGFARTLLDLIHGDTPSEYIAVTFDQGMSGREQLFPDYKGHRDRTPDELQTQLPIIRDLVRAFNIPIIEYDGFEADDVIGTAARLANEGGMDVLIVTGDRDLFQLITPEGATPITEVELPGDDEPWNAARVKEKYGVTVGQYVDYKALIGDSSDNIPGVKGVGEKTAARIFAHYDTLEEIYAALEADTLDLTTRFTNALKRGKEEAYLSRELSRIKRDLPVTVDPRACVAQDYDPKDVIALFHAMEFRTLTDRLIEQSDAVQKPSGPAVQLSFLGGDDAPEDIAPVTETIIVDDKEALAAMLEALEGAEVLAFDTETTELDAMRAGLVGISLAVEPGRAYYVPVGHVQGKQLLLARVIEALTPALTDPDLPKVAHNADFDIKIMARHGVRPAPIAFDTMLAAWLLNPAARVGLKDLAEDELRIKMTAIKELIGSGRNQKSFAEVPVKQAAPYGAADSDMTLRLRDVYAPRIEGQDAVDLFEKMEMPLIDVLVDMEMRGVLLDSDYLSEMSGQLTEQIAALDAKIAEIAGHDFNANSTQQLSDVLFNEMRAPTDGLRKTKTGHFSTAAGVLEGLLQHDETTGTQKDLIRAVLEQRELSKLQSTYVDALPALVNPQTGRIHTSFNQTGTTTGRLSSSNPNLQNIPARTARGREVRHAFIAPEGWLLLAADYSQIELRVLAQVSGDEGLRKAFREGQDIHRSTAAAVHGIAPEDVTYEQRSFAKSVNFGLMYGMGAYRLARESDLTLKEAQDFIETYFKRFPNVRAYFEGTRRFLYEHKYVETLFGRRRYFEGVDFGSDSRSRADAERAAINMPIQGTASDILKLAMIELHRLLRARKLEARMILQVHDELVLEVPEGELAETGALVREVMEGVPALARREMDPDFTFEVPLVVDAQVGRDWGSMEDWQNQEE